MSEVTQILEAIDRGEKQAAKDLLPLVYDELRKLAAQHLAQEKPGQTLQPTALVHEGWGAKRHFSESISYSGIITPIGQSSSPVRVLMVMVYQGTRLS